jgi:hypothetical protein
MKKNLVIFFVLYLSLNQQVYAHGPNCAGHNHHHTSRIEDVKHMVMNSYNHALEWYNGHALFVNSVALLGVTYFLYKKYCPVANRCEECLEDSKSINVE